VREKVQKHDADMQFQQKIETKVTNVKDECDDSLRFAQAQNMAAQKALHNIMQRLHACANLIKEREQTRDELRARAQHR